MPRTTWELCRRISRNKEYKDAVKKSIFNDIWWAVLYDSEQVIQFYVQASDENIALAVAETVNNIKEYSFNKFANINISKSKTEHITDISENIYINIEDNEKIKERTLERLCSWNNLKSKQGTAKTAYRDILEDINQQISERTSISQIEEKEIKIKDWVSSEEFERDVEKIGDFDKIQECISIFDEKRKHIMKINETAASPIKTFDDYELRQQKEAGIVYEDLDDMLIDILLNNQTFVSKDEPIVRYEDGEIEYGTCNPEIEECLTANDFKQIVKNGLLSNYEGINYCSPVVAKSISTKLPKLNNVRRRSSSRKPVKQPENIELMDVIM